MISLSLLFLFSCQKTKFQWEPSISAPKYYPVGDVKIDFGNAGHGSLTNFDNGWGDTYGAVSSGDIYKEAPKEVFISYVSAIDNLVYKGEVLLPQEHIRSLFEKYKLDKKDNLGYLVVGMAPNGWIRVWFQTIDKKANDLVCIELAKAKLKGYEDNTIGEGFRNKKSKYWDKYKIYWQLHGIPYEAWANNEKEYDMYFDFYKQEKNKVGFNYISADGTYYQKENEKCYQKLPVQFNPIAWLGKSNIVYECNVAMPKNFKKYIEQKKLKEVKLKFELEDDDQHAVIYLITNNLKEKIMRFKNKTPTAEEKKNNDYYYATEVEYFIK
ncbi:hypothetical protein GCM10010992_27360 [Cloacibacterium rupense]|uniref:DUF2931 family protein n=2 Tax=Cloacibacterium rupense TaxID=517423 RepID=A0ABQ2NMJ0_9FLAO|nr:hypothetical protein GCM10010992_27360 [Cloacibacterium rupense]